MNAYLHLDVATHSTPRHTGEPIGDVVRVTRDKAATVIILADGLGHGITAQVAATLYSARLAELLRRDFSLRDAFLKVAHDIHATRADGGLYAALVLARVRPSGETTILTYDAPAAIFVGAQVASVLAGHTLDGERALIREAHCFLEAGEGLLLMSDGVTQAGLGRGLRDGFTSDGVARFVTDCLGEQVPLAELGRRLHLRARELWGEKQGDDVTATLLSARIGQPLVLLSGPPANRSNDARAMREFLDAPGKKVICGASSAMMAARFLGKSLKVDQENASAITPPRYYLDGIDLVTEGVVTLNQVLNIVGADPTRYEPDNSVSTLTSWLKEADRIDFLVGRAANLGGSDIAFLQQGIQPRQVVIPLLADALTRSGKLVTCAWF